MLLLAYLLKLNPQWENAKIRILSIVREVEQKDKLEKGISSILPKARIQAEVAVILSQTPFKEVLHERSSDSDIVFLGLPKSKTGEESQHAKNMDALCHGLQTVVFVQNNSMSHSIPILLKV